MDTMDVVETLQEKSSHLPSTNVEREDNGVYDLGNLAYFDPKPIFLKDFNENGPQTLLDAARDNVQLLINKLFLLPTAKPQHGVSGVLAYLPQRVTVIPREKPMAQAKPLTKWQQFALEKGINKKKKDRLVYDDNTGEIRPRFGFRRANNDDEWVVEAKKGEDPSIDPFTRKEMEKKKKELLRTRSNKRRIVIELQNPMVMEQMQFQEYQSSTMINRSVSMTKWLALIKF